MKLYCCDIAEINEGIGNRPLSLVLVLVGAFGSMLLPAQGSQEHGMSAIKKAWTDRQNAVRSVQMKWTDLTTYKVNSLPRRPGSQIAPLPETSQTYKTSLIVDGEKLRFSRDGDYWDLNEDRFLPNHFVSTFDGAANMAFYDNPADSTARYRSGFIMRQDESQEVSNYETWAILFCIRALHARMSRLSKQPWSILPGKGELNGRSVIVLERTMDGTNETCWLDPERKYTICRYLKKGGNRAFQLDISYKEDPVLRDWVPSSWSWAQMDGNLNPQIISKVEVTEQEFNSSFPEETFTFSFPPGTLVTDSSQLDENKQPLEYLLKTGGTKRYVSQEDRLAARDPAELRRNLANKSHGSLYWVLALLAVGVLLYLVNKRFPGLRFWRTKKG